MNRRVFFAIPLAILVACSGTEPTAPSVKQQSPELAISDGSHAPGNADFFFLPPMVLPTGGFANWTTNGFNGLLSPSVVICRLVATTIAAVATTAGSQCRTSNPTPVTLSGTAVKKHFPPVSDPTDVITGLPGDWAHYHAKFLFPSNCNTTFFYRVRVMVGTVDLGFADVQCVTSLGELFRVDFRKFGAGFRGVNLQIPFRIEKYALCAVPGVGPCASAEVFLNVAAATVSLPPNPGDPPGSQPSGVTIPRQTPPLPPTVITVQDCPDLFLSGVTDLPTFGRCIRITSNPTLPPLTILATVFVCNLGIALPANISHPQSERITLHRYDAGATQPLAALPHDVGCPQFEPPASIGSIKGVLQELAQGRLASAGGQLLGVFAPQPLYARRLNLGAGGKTCCFSDFEFALPAYMTIESGDGQVALPGSTLPNDPTVRVRDLGGENVAGARVTFTATQGSANPILVLTNSNGLAATQWTIGTNPGPNTLVASGLGIAGSDHNGPRCGLDPFQAIQTGPFFPSEFGPGSQPCGPGEPRAADAAEPVVTGSQSFTANGASPVIASGLLGSSSDARGVGPNSGSLFTIDPSTGVATLVGAAGVLSPSSAPEMSDIALDPSSGTLYGIVGSNCSGANLVTLNASSGAGTLVGPLVGSGFDGSQPGGSPTPCNGGSEALAIATDGTMYAGGWNGGFTLGSLLRINKATGAVLERAATTSGISLSGLSFDGSGNLWASRGGNGPGLIHTIGTVSGVNFGQTLSTLALLNAAGGQDLAFVSDLAFGNGVMYASLPNEGQLATIDLGTGLLTRIGSWGAAVNKMSGLGFGASGGGCGSCSFSYLTSRTKINAADLYVGGPRITPPAVRSPQASPQKKVAKRPVQ